MKRTAELLIEFCEVQRQIILSRHWNQDSSRLLEQIDALEDKIWDALERDGG